MLNKTNNRQVKVDGKKFMRPKPYTKNCRKRKNAESGGNNLPQEENTNCFPITNNQS